MLTQQRQGEIALMIVKKMIRDKGIKLRPGQNRQLAQEAKNLGIEYSEIVEFVKEQYRELFETHMDSLETVPTETSKLEDDGDPAEHYYKPK